MRQFLPLAKSIFLISIIRTGRWSRPSFTSQGPLYLGALLGVLGYPELPISILDLVEPCDDFLPFWFCTNLGSVFSFDLTLLKSLLPPQPVQSIGKLCASSHHIIIKNNIDLKTRWSSGRNQKQACSRRFAFQKQSEGCAGGHPWSPLDSGLQLCLLLVVCWPLLTFSALSRYFFSSNMRGTTVWLTIGSDLKMKR